MFTDVQRFFDRQRDLFLQENFCQMAEGFGSKLVLMTDCTHLVLSGRVEIIDLLRSHRQNLIAAEVVEMTVQVTAVSMHRGALFRAFVELTHCRGGALPDQLVTSEYGLRKMPGGGYQIELVFDEEAEALPGLHFLDTYRQGAA